MVLIFLVKSEKNINTKLVENLWKLSMFVKLEYSTLIPCQLERKKLICYILCGRTHLVLKGFFGCCGLEVSLASYLKPSHVRCVYYRIFFIWSQEQMFYWLSESVLMNMKLFVEASTLEAERFNRDWNTIHWCEPRVVHESRNVILVADWHAVKLFKVVSILKQIKWEASHRHRKM